MSGFPLKWQVLLLLLKRMNEHLVCSRHNVVHVVRSVWLIWSEKASTSLPTKMLSWQPACGARDNISGSGNNVHQERREEGADLKLMPSIACPSIHRRKLQFCLSARRELQNKGLPSIRFLHYQRASFDDWVERLQNAPAKSSLRDNIESLADETVHENYINRARKEWCTSHHGVTKVLLHHGPQIQAGSPDHEVLRLRD
jgi:hypothetical protein